MLLYGNRGPNKFIVPIMESQPAQRNSFTYRKLGHESENEETYMKIGRKKPPDPLSLLENTQ